MAVTHTKVGRMLSERLDLSGRQLLSLLLFNLQESVLVGEPQ